MKRLESLMKVYVVCSVHKEVICLGEEGSAPEEPITHFFANTTTIWAGLSRFMFVHRGCSCNIMSENLFWDMDLIGFRRKDNAYGIPFKGPENLTLDNE
jgi:hypothetical protein